MTHPTNQAFFACPTDQPALAEAERVSDMTITDDGNALTEDSRRSPAQSEKVVFI